jgi:outer membrane protein assembly factor BamB
MSARHLAAFAVAFVLTLGAASPTTANTNAWPQFQSSWTHAGFNAEETVLSTRNVAHLGVAWRVTLADGVYGSVAAVGERLFAATWSGEIYALRANDGKRLWHRSLGMPAARTTPAVWQNLVIVAGGTWEGSMIAAYDAGNGVTRWMTRVPGDISLSGPTVAGSTVYVASTSGIVYSLSAATGHIKWARTLASEIDGPVAVSAGQAYVYAAGLDGMVYGLSSASGRVVWQVKAGGGIFHGGPAVSHGIVYVASGKTGAEGGGFQTVAMQATDGLILWRSDTGDDVHVTPSVAGDSVYVGAINGTLTSVDAYSGSRHWMVTIGPEIWSSAALANGVVYLTTESSFVALRASSGAMLYSYSLASGFAGMSSPSVAHGHVYVGTPDGGVIAFGLR